MSNKQSTLPPDYQLHWYTIKSVLGQGGFGVTYLAHDNNLDRDVAIKEYMPRELAIRSENFTITPAEEGTTESLQWGLERFIREARTLSKFEHPNIVRVHTVFEENNTAYMIMSYENGRSFMDILNEGKQLDEEELLEIIMPLLDGLEMMHERGFIHRDIKPANIFIRENGSSVLLDFGSARQAMDDEAKTLTKFVSPGYAPFEQYYGKSDIQGPWTDIYGLGATLYRAIVGEPPMDSTFRNRSTGEKAIKEIWDVLDQYSGKYSTFFLRAIEHSLRTNHKDRPQTIAEWRTMFNEPNVSTETQWRLAAAGSKEKKSPAKYLKPARKESPKRMYILFGIAILILAIAAILIPYLKA